MTPPPPAVRAITTATIHTALADADHGLDPEQLADAILTAITSAGYGIAVDHGVRARGKPPRGATGTDTTETQ